MKRRRRSRALLLAVIPGWGHIYWGREIVGLSVFTVASVLGFTLLNGVFVYRGEGQAWLVWGAGIALLALSVGAWLEMFWRTLPSRVSEEERDRAQRFERAAAAYLRNDLAAAAGEYRECLRIDPQDVEALFRFSVVCARRGDARQAKRWLRKTTRYDLEDKWRWEVERELTRLRGGCGAQAPTESESEKEEEAEPASA